ncbi:MAG: family 10 glycosylhydrolase [Kiritimatiellae bacterium]|nr:family 10 glycosylhydrolase [Kiritimatiellia bacterium]
MRKIISLFAAGVLFFPLYSDNVKGWKEIKAEGIVPGGDNAPAELVEPGHFSFTSDFSKLKAVRAVWDIPINCNLADKNGFQFEFFCSGAEFVSGFRFFAKSGRGWYAATIKPPENPGWCKVSVTKADFSTIEGKVEGWRNIKVLRLAAIRSGRGVLTMQMRSLSYLATKGCLAGVVRSDSCAADPRYEKEAKGLAKFALNVNAAISDAGVPVTAISDMDIDDDSLKGLKLLVFPYNPTLPKGKIKAVENFVKNGGKIFACHSIDSNIRKILGISEERYFARKWRSSSETPTAEKNGYYLDHVWRYSPEDSKRQMHDLLLRVEPSWRNLLEARKKIQEEKSRKEAQWIAGQPSKEGEWRAFWCHSEQGLKDHTWDEAIKLLKENGFNAILPNLAWAGTAFYDSKVLPVNSSVATDGDALEQCLAACRKYGVECHVWKVCWRLGSKSDKKVVEKFKSQGRLQRSNQGKQFDWLCPSRPENLQQEIDAFVELAQKGVDGIHFDYIRYKNESFCFCDHCRKAFENRLGRVVEGWPQSVVKCKDPELLAKWHQFRCDTITALVKGVSERVRRIAPKVKLSAAVFHSPERDPATIGQDWVAWCRNGLLDFVCPMDYYGRLGPLLEMQKHALADAPVKLRPGLGLSCWENPRDDAIKMTKQIKIVRDAGLDGFSVFDFDLRSASVIPVLHTGPTRTR